MPDERLCSTCTNTLSPQHTGTLCPACLMGIGLHSVETLEVEGKGPGKDSGKKLGKSTGASDDDTLDVGSRIGPFTLLSKLGEGGMGVVFEANDAETGRRVALKVLKQALNTSEARGRFLREGRSAASVNHPNSVYVYGTHDIDDRLLISMELVSGGTLEDEVRREGALPVVRVADAVLQVIDGLEAAQQAGVLHRDMKPSNCFVDEAGRVKVGDFGLSISTDGSEDSLITRQNVILGTPAFSAPEQLRGEVLDVRSDIYSLGGTLFYLLSGQTPFKAGNLVQLIATVLEHEAPLVSTLEPAVPGELAAIVQRCLHKAPEKRWGSYADLRAALLPFSSQVPVPAGLGTRLLAGVVDQGIIGTCGLLFFPLVGFSEFPSAILSVVLGVIYFSISEIGYRASPGKALFGLRLASTPGRQINAGAILLRLVIYMGFLKTAEVIHADSDYATFGLIIATFSMLLFPVILFSTMRRRNGYAGLHDLATGLRVVHQMHATAPDVAHPFEDDFTEPNLAAIGPYHRLSAEEEQPGGRVSIAYDDRLLRGVWVLQPNDPQQLSDARRHLVRPTRLRWINRAQEVDESWEAFEAPSGSSLLTLAAAPEALDTRMVEGCLLDLAQEIEDAQEDGSLPPTLALDQVWIGRGGQVKLLDFAAPRRFDSSPASAASLEPSQFLVTVARAALYGVDETEDGIQLRNPRPIALSARRLIDDLEAGVSPARLESRSDSQSRRFAFTRQGRFLRSAIFLFPAIFFALMMLVIRQFGGLELLGNDESSSIPPDVLIYSSLIICSPSGPSEEELIPHAQLLAVAYPGLTETDERWTSDESLQIMNSVAVEFPVYKERLVTAIEEHANPDPQAVSNALAQVQEALASHAESSAGWMLNVFQISVSFQFILWMFIFYAGAPTLIAALLFRGGLIIHGFGLCVVNRHGAPAHRLRIFSRALLLVGPVVIVLAILVVGAPGLLKLTLALSLLFVPPLVSILLPVRSLADRLAGTWLVPR